MEGCNEIVLFGTRIVVDSMRKTASLNNLSDYQHVADAANPSAKAAGDGHVSDYVAARAGTVRERKRGTPWSEEEHKRFLVGLKKVGKGDWRTISKNFVKTRTPTQVASHAQKYFLRHTTVKSRRRTSLFDITTETLNCQMAGKMSEEKPESANGVSASSQPPFPTTGSYNACLTPMVPALPAQTSLTLQLFPSSNSNSVMNYSPLSLDLKLSLPTHTQASPNPAFSTMPGLMSKDSYISVA